MPVLFQRETPDVANARGTNPVGWVIVATVVTVVFCIALWWFRRRAKGPKRTVISPHRKRKHGHRHHHQRHHHRRHSNGHRRARSDTASSGDEMTVVSLASPDITEPPRVHPRHRAESVTSDSAASAPLLRPRF